jgi:hypothetical protein
MYALLQAYTSGKGVDMSLDMHRGAVHNNLWSNIDVGLGTRAFLSSGDSGRGAHAGRWPAGWVDACLRGCDGFWAGELARSCYYCRA